MPILDDELKSLARRDMEERLQELGVVEFGDEVTAEFTLREIRKAKAAHYINDRLHVAPGSTAIYTIAADKSETIQGIIDAFPRDRARRDYSLPRINPYYQDSKTIYVGSSEGVQSRLREHLWRAAHRTYALHLNRWCPDLDGSMVVHIQPLIKPVSRQARQDLEDALWRKLKPLYGKSGGR
ncbi:hypothetical protein HJB52_20700 [Rhizobium lentis]|uniref:hypothetical protein n=1 Tax=Rhizobium lentis TaxID=1138194 RepID=UPI001C828554|nr:hypothetical protein [Rhizobium lentis]MBX5070497.1 hypothetical protein [Rhizobium lentis]MBX5104250.1 hypothetical protein [Rhizobium lentis]